MAQLKNTHLQTRKEPPMPIFQDGYKYKGTPGVLITYQEYEPAGFDREPSGHIFQQVKLKRPVERWFHPYNGKPPFKLPYL